MTFGELLNEHLLRNDRPAAWLADRLGNYPSTVTRWLNDESRPRDLETVVRIADILAVPAGEERRALIESAGFAYFETPASAQEEEAQDTAPDPPASPTSAPVTRTESPPSPLPEPPAPLAPSMFSKLPMRLRQWLRWDDAPEDVRVSWAGMTLHLLRRLVATLPIQLLQAFLITLALWLATAALLEPILQWPLEDRAKLGPAAWRLTLACLLIPPLTALVTRPDGYEHFAPQNLHQSSVLWFLKLAGAYAGFGGFVGIVLGFALLVYQAGGPTASASVCRLLALPPLLFCHVGARRIPYERFRLYGELRTHPADRLLLPVTIGFGPLLALFIYLANGLLINPLVGFAVLIGLILLIWWERRFAR